MNSIRVFLGPRLATDGEVLFIYYWGLAVSSAVIISFEAVHRARGWKLVAGATILAGGVVALAPIVITYAIVWPGILIAWLSSSFGLGATVGISIANFVAITIIHAAVFVGWFKISKWRASRKLTSE